MTNKVVTITDKHYIKYTEQFVKSVKEAGWRERVIVFTSDRNIKIKNCVMAYMSRPRIRHSKEFTDDRWLKCLLLKSFKYGDRIFYCDSDIIMKKGFEKYFKYRFAVTRVKYDPTGEFPLIQKYTKEKIKDKCLDCLFVVEKTRQHEAWFKLWQMAMNASICENRGTMLAFNFAEKMSDIRLAKLPRKWMYITIDRLMNRERDDGILCYHYGGAKGKFYWDKDDERDVWDFLDV